MPEKMFIVTNCNLGCVNTNSEPMPETEARKLFDNVLMSYRRGLHPYEPEIYPAISKP